MEPDVHKILPRVHAASKIELIEITFSTLARQQPFNTPDIVKRAIDIVQHFAVVINVITGQLYYSVL